MGLLSKIFAPVNHNHQKYSAENNYDKASSYPLRLHTDDVKKNLNSEYGINISSSYKLHLLMEKMGIIEKVNDGWLLTEYGRTTYTTWSSRLFNPTDGWKPEIVKDIANFIHQNNIDIQKIGKNSH